MTSRSFAFAARTRRRRRLSNRLDVARVVIPTFFARAVTSHHPPFAFRLAFVGIMRSSPFVRSFVRLALALAFVTFVTSRRVSGAELERGSRVRARASLDRALDAARALDRALSDLALDLDRIDEGACEDVGKTCARGARAEAREASEGARDVDHPSHARLTVDDLAREIRSLAHERVKERKASANDARAFAEAFELVSTAREAFATSATHVLPFRYGKGKQPRYYAIANDEGGIAVYDLLGGERKCAIGTTTRARATSLTAYMATMNTSVIVSGHEDGTIAFTKVEVAVATNVGVDSIDFPTKAWASCSAETSTTARAADVKHKTKLRSSGRTSAGEELNSKAIENALANGAIESLGMYRIMGKRFVAAADVHGRVVVFMPTTTDLANIHGVFYTNARVFAFRPYGKAIVALTERGVVVADIAAFTTKVYSCENLMFIEVARATFDPLTNSKLVGIDREGRFFTGYVGLDGPKMGCVVHRPGDAQSYRVAASGLATIKGYILIAVEGGVEVLNSTLTRSPQVVMRTNNGELLASGGVEKAVADDHSPILSTDGERYIIVAHTQNGVVSVYKSIMYTLPAPRLIGENIWFQPLAFMIAIGVGIWSYKKSRIRNAVDDRAPRSTEDALRKLGFGIGLHKTDDPRGMYGEKASSRPAYQEWTVEKMRKEIAAAKRNGDL